MSKKLNIRKAVILSLAAIMVAAALSGCASVSHKISDLKGRISGNEYYIDTFDNYGHLTLKTHGKKISIEPNVVKDTIYSDDSWQEVKTESSVISITIDGKDVESCGDTCIFYDTRLKPDYDFTADTIESDDNGNPLNNAVFAKSINKIKNKIGKSRVVVIKSQMGTPIYAFSGDKIYWEVADDLPKFTKLSVDGKPLYIHRANFQIIDKKLIDKVE
ncbi:MAG: DUF5052 family protein [Eubacteriales bacterium]|nr:DUF5052 family protein [Eubacteriales bacterium]